MADSDKLIGIFPETGISGLLPRIEFTGKDNKKVSLQTEDNNDLHFVNASGNSLLKITTSGLIVASGGDSGKWNEAYSWGDHSLSGYALDNTVVKTTGDQTISGAKTFADLIYLDGSFSSIIFNSTGSALFFDPDMNIGFDRTGSDLVLSNNSTGYIDLTTNTFSRLHITNDGNVGIGTTTPAGKLSVDGHIGLVPRASTTGWNNAFYTYHNSSTHNSYGLTLGYESGTQRYTHMIFAPEYADVSFAFDPTNYNHEVSGLAGFSTKMLIRGDTGNVGIGTSAPSSKLDVNGNVSISSTGLNGESLFSIEGTNGNLFSVVDSVSGSLMSVNDITGLPAFEVFSDHSVVAGRFNANDFVISSGGNVGIGTSAPSGKLHISGNQYITDGSLYIHNTSASTPYTHNRIYNDQYDSLILLSNGSKLTLGGQGGNAVLHANSTYLELGNPYNAGTTNQYITFKPANSEAMRITNAGNVGIGTNSPSTKLDVSGVIAASGGNSTNWNTAYGWGNHAGLYAAASHNHDDRYYTETESDTRFINASGDSMTGFLNLHADPTGVLQAATKQYVDSILATNNAMIFKGSIGSGGIGSLPTSFEAGWSYVVTTAGTYANQACEQGDLIIATIDRASGGTDADWIVVQTNINGAVVGPASATNGNFPVFNGTTGKLIANSSYGPSSFYLSTNPSGYTANAGTVTSVAALTIGTTGTDVSSTVANGTTTPVITINIPTASASNRGALSSTDWTTFNNKQNALTNPVTGTGTNNYISKWTGTTSQGNSLIYDNGTNIGLGTSSPSGLLHINHARDVHADVIFKIRTTNFDDGAVWTDADLTFFERDGGINSDFMHFKKTGSSIFRIDNSGRVGIGTSTPDAKLVVNGDSYTVGKLGVGGACRSNLSSDLGSSAGLTWNDGSFIGMQYSNADDYRMGLTFWAANRETRIQAKTGDSTGKITFYPGAGTAEAGRFHSNGYFGLGTTTPSQKLDVVGIGKFGEAPDVVYVGNDNIGGEIGISTASNYIAAYTTADSKFRYGGNGSTTIGIVIDSSQNVGIGTESPSYKLQVNGSFGATTKSFRIDHPSRPNYTLEYGSLESPYHGVRLTGRGKVVKGSGTVLLPSYLKDLIHDDENINIQITNIKHGKTIYVDEIDLNNDQFTVRVDRAKTLGNLEFFWTLTGVRKDVDNLVVEREK